MSKLLRQIDETHAELRHLKLEEASINQISEILKQQLNTYKVEAKAFNNACTDKNETQPLTSTIEESPSAKPSNDTFYPTTSDVVATTQTEQLQEFNFLEDPDLMVPLCAGMYEMSSDEDDVDECLW